MDESGSAEQVFRVALGEHLRALRCAKGSSTVELAARTGVTVDVIDRVERGDASPTIELLRRWVGEGLGMRLGDFFAALEPAGERDDEGRLVRIFRDARPGVRRLILGIARTLARE